MSFAIALSDRQWELVADLFDPPGHRSVPAIIPRRQMVDAMLFIGSIAHPGCDSSRACPSEPEFRLQGLSRLVSMPRSLA